jgi:hypothetical protein
VVVVRADRSRAGEARGRVEGRWKWRAGGGGAADAAGAGRVEATEGKRDALAHYRVDVARPSGFSGRMPTRKISQL